MIPFFLGASQESRQKATVRRLAEAAVAASPAAIGGADRQVGCGQKRGVF
jgi:hypothetical protein